MQNRLLPYMEPIVRQLVNAGLLMPSRGRQRGVVLGASLLLWSVGGGKLAVDMANDIKPFFFLVLLLLVAQIALLVLMHHAGQRTALGRKVLQASRKRLAAQRARPVAEQVGDAHGELVLGVALLGTQFLQHIPGSEETLALFKPTQFEFTNSSDGGYGGSFGDGGDSSDGGGDGGGD